MVPMLIVKHVPFAKYLENGAAFHMGYTKRNKVFYLSPTN
jgi:hypothetical protein